MSKSTEFQEKPSKVDRITERFKEKLPNLSLSSTASSYLEKFDHNQTDGITCWRSEQVHRQDGSKIEGVGLFTTSKIKPGEVIGIKPGHVVDTQTIKDKSDIINGSHQQIGINQFLTGLTEDEVDKNLVGYNHSCEPNSKVVIIKGEQLAFLVAKRPINEGDEITTDYSESQMSNTHRIFVCNCGTEKCRRIIQPGSDWEQEDFQEDHVDSFPQFMQDEIDQINQMSESEREAKLRQNLVLRAADAINLLAGVIEDSKKRIAELPAIYRPLVKVLNTKAMGQDRQLLFEYAQLFVQICPFTNIEEMGIDRNDPATIKKNMGQLVEFAKNMDRHFNF